MTKEKIIYELVKKSLLDTNGAKFLELSEMQWQEVYEELCEQTINGMLAEYVLSYVVLPKNLRVKWEKQYMSQVSFFYQLLYEQNELVTLMDKYCIPMVILKGVAAAIYYPQPSMRLMGDVDFLVPESEFQRALSLMIENGYQLIYEESFVDYHLTLKKGKFVYELHKEPAGMPEGKEKEKIQRLLEEGMGAINSVLVESYQIPVLPSVPNGIVLLLHIAKHLRHGLGLRQIIDWMMYVKQELDDEKWYQVMLPVLQDTKYEKLAKIVTRMCQMYFGLEQENTTWCQDVDSHVCENMMSYIMEHGNFGRKIRKEEDYAARVWEDVHNPIELMRVLQKKGEEEWNKSNKNPIFRSFAWVYICWRYLGKMIRKKSPIKKIKRDVKSGKIRRDLFDEIDF